MENAKFQFKDFIIKRSLIDVGDDIPSTKLSLNFFPRGIIDKSKGNFQLSLGVLINDDGNNLKLEVDAIANFLFDKEVSAEMLDSYFYINAPAILFPYIRAYISTLTNLSGSTPVTLPTMNLISLGDDLKNNTIELD